jgi:hypothetical protein
MPAPVQHDRNPTFKACAAKATKALGRDGVAALPMHVSVKAPAMSDPRLISFQYKYFAGRYK